MTRTRLALTALALLGAVVATAAPAQARFARANYLYNSYDRCMQSKSPTDPNTVAFIGRGAYINNIIREFADHTRGLDRQWLHRTSLENDLYSRDNGNCWRTNAHIADRLAIVPKTRWHVRLAESSDDGQLRSSDGSYQTMAAPHYEDVVAKATVSGKPFCHAVKKGAVDREPEDVTSRGSGFDQGRAIVERMFARSGRHEIVRRNWGNTRSAKQCDGDWAGSDGRAILVRIGSGG